MKQNIVAGLIGAVSVVLVTGIVVHVVTAFSLWVPNPWFHEGNGPMSIVAWVSYFISGVITGVAVKGPPIRTVLTTAALVWLLYTVLDLSDWQYFMGLAEHHMPVQIEGYIYHAQLLVVVAILMSAGGVFGWRIKNRGDTRNNGRVASVRSG